ncbi:MAG: hypothetical protein JWM28_4346 [Chitinophagaceae bacterium]|nr:hypothetical protein [Chitinophagaceae bacterium]
MDISGVFVLANDVEFIPVDSVTEKTRSRFEYEKDDMLITQLNARTASKIISRDLAALLQEFRSPKSLAEGIYVFCESQAKDPQQVADDVFSSLVNMHQWGFLIPFDLQEGPLNQGLLPSKECFRTYTILEKYQQYDDTEVYRVKDGSENIFALKIMPAANDAHIQNLFNNEITVLRLLDGVMSPKLIEHGRQDDIYFLVTEWCDGLTCEQESMKFRNINIRDHIIQLLNIAVAILEAYHHLHRQKILHGDIHPDNIFISSTGGVKIIDFGYASLAGHTAGSQRGGTGFYYEPEFAVASLQEMPPPPVTEKAEQYSIAVLLYYLISGHHYLAFSFEREKLFNQIANDEPLSFKNYDLEVPEALENVLATALAKDPEKRFSSLEEFGQAISNIRSDVFASNRFYVHNKQNEAAQLVTFVLQKSGWDSPFIDKGFTMAPTCSVNYGAAGTAYMFYRISCVRQDARLSDIADVWVNRALMYQKDYDQSFYSSAIGITQKTVGKRSIYHSPTGVYLVQALISNSRGDWLSLSNAVKGFLSAAAVECEKIDLALGKSGLLVGCSLLYKELKTVKNYPVSDIMLFAEQIMKEIWDELDGYSPMNQSNPVDYFGMAHGWAGLLYATLLWCNATNSALPGNFVKRVDELLSCSILSENNLRWPLTVGDKSSWPGWCNGSAGHIFLWVLLYKHFNEEKFIRVAEKLAGHLMSEVQSKNPDLCCGLAGNAYAMMSLYKITNENIYLQEMQRIRQGLLKNWVSQPIRNNSLYKGEAGIALFLCEMDNPALARMPLFE